MFVLDVLETAYLSPGTLMELNNASAGLSKALHKIIWP